MVVISADEYGRPQVAPTVERMVKQFKGAVTKKIGASIWQKSYYVTPQMTTIPRQAVGVLFAFCISNFAYS